MEGRLEILGFEIVNVLFDKVFKQGIDCKLIFSILFILLNKPCHNPNRLSLTLITFIIALVIFILLLTCCRGRYYEFDSFEQLSHDPFMYPIKQFFEVIATALPFDVCESTHSLSPVYTFPNDKWEDLLFEHLSDNQREGQIHELLTSLLL